MARAAADLVRGESETAICADGVAEAVGDYRLRVRGYRVIGRRRLELLFFNSRARFFLSAFAVCVALLYFVLDPTGALLLIRNLALFVLMIIPLVWVHELAHLIFAKALGIKVLAFAFGFGRELIGRDVFGIRWTINAIPAGGYVKLLGEEENEGPNSFAAASAWKKVMVLIAGSIANLFFGFAILVILVLIYGASPEKAPASAMQIIHLILTSTLNAILNFLPMALSHPMDIPISGVPGMIDVSGTLFTDDKAMFIVLIAAISISMGIMNLLPIPPMDGGQALIVVIDSAIGRGRVPTSVFRVARIGGLIILLSVMILINLIDFIRIIIGYTPKLH